MFDNLRNEAESSFYEEDEADLFPELNPEPATPPPPKQRSSGRLLGMTAPQRFVIAVMLMVATCTLGIMCLLVTGRFGLY